MMRIVFGGSVFWAVSLTGALGVMAQPIGKPATVVPAANGAESNAAIVAEYNKRRDKIPDTSDAHHDLGVWCEQNGLKSQAVKLMPSSA